MIAGTTFDGLTLENVLEPLLNVLSLEEQSRLSKICTIFNLRISPRHTRLATEIIKKEKLEHIFEVDLKQVKIEQLRKIAFNNILGFRSLPVCMQNRLNPFFLEFINNGQLQKTGIFNTFHKVKIHLQALNSGIELQAYQSYRHQQEMKNLFNLFFKEGRWIELQDKECKIEQKVPNNFHDLFDKIDKIQTSILKNSPSILDSLSIDELPKLYLSYFDELPKVNVSFIDPSEIYFVDLVCHAMFRLNTVIDSPFEISNEPAIASSKISGENNNASSIDLNDKMSNNSFRARFITKVKNLKRLLKKS